MNSIQLLGSQQWVSDLGLTLLHFLWQGVAIALLYAIARRLLGPEARPNARYGLGCAALLLMTAAPLVTFAWLEWPAVEPLTITAAERAAAPSSGIAGQAATSALFSITADTSERLLPWVVALWLMGATAFWVRLLAGWMLARQLRTRFVRPAPPQWQTLLDGLRQRVTVVRSVRLLVSPLIESPAVIGWLRPVVLMPVGALAGLPADQVEALLLHELAHIRRHDYLINALQGVVESLLFYHPAVWWISDHIRTERELCCDDAAVSVTGDAVAYACALAELASASQARFGPAVAANGGSLSHRIGRLLGESRSAPRTVSGPGTAGAAVLLIAAAVALFGQSNGPVKFEAASIKPSDNPGLQNVRPMPGRLLADSGLNLLIQNAYSVQAYQIEGIPKSVGSERYQIEAKAAGNVGRAQILRMLQALLADRFHLKVHRETRDLPVYAMVAAKGGLKIAPPREGACEDAAPDAPAEWSIGRMLPPSRTPPGMPGCGTIGVGLEMAGAHMRGGNVAMPDLVKALSLVLGRNVIDKTGYTGRFDVQLLFQTDEATPSMPPPPPGAAFDTSTPNIFAALQERMGLKLEPAKGPVEVIVVDHVEPPSGN